MEISGAFAVSGEDKVVWIHRVERRPNWRIVGPVVGGVAGILAVGGLFLTAAPLLTVILCIVGIMAIAHSAMSSPFTLPRRGPLLLTMDREADTITLHDPSESALQPLVMLVPSAIERIIVTKSARIVLARNGTEAAVVDNETLWVHSANAKPLKVFPGDETGRPSDIALALKRCTDLRPEHMHNDEAEATGAIPTPLAATAQPPPCADDEFQREQKARAIAASFRGRANRQIAISLAGIALLASWAGVSPRSASIAGFGIGGLLLSIAAAIRTRGRAGMEATALMQRTAPSSPTSKAQGSTAANGSTDASS